MLWKRRGREGRREDLRENEIQYSFFSLRPQRAPRFKDPNGSRA